MEILGTLLLYCLGLVCIFFGDIITTCPGASIAFYVVGGLVIAGASFAAMIKFMIKYKR